uniref:Uncharacterized protein n=1 Tax=Steinernema glaseri TaxID=37863 RepID=A0A1I7YJR3_9BILA
MSRMCSLRPPGTQIDSIPTKTTTTTKTMFARNSTTLLLLLALACLVSAVHGYGVVFVDEADFAPEGTQPLLFNRFGRMDPSWVQMGFGKRSGGEFDKRQQVKLQRGYSAIGLGRR